MSEHFAHVQVLNPDGTGAMRSWQISEETATAIAESLGEPDADAFTPNIDAMEVASDHTIMSYRE